MNICGVLVHTHPDRSEEVAQAIRSMAGAELHHMTPDGRMIVTVEDTAEESAGDAALAIHRLRGVLSAALVYHHFEPQTATEPVAENFGE